MSDKASADSPDAVPDDSDSFILIPMLVLFGILILAALVYLMARNRHRLTHIYENRKDEYNNGDSDDAKLLKDDELDDPTEYLLNGKLEIGNRYTAYKATTSHGQHASEA